jgi:hypothetical protein
MPSSLETLQTTAVPAKSDHLPPWLQKLEHLLEGLFKIGNFRFGLDSLVGLFPGGGDALTAVVGSVIVLAGAWQGLPKIVLLRMVVNVCVDLFIGLVPVVGDALDFVYRSNRQNLQMYREALAGTRNLRRDYWVVGLVGVCLAVAVIVPVYLAVKLWAWVASF